MNLNIDLKKELIVVGGPTASGKTDIAIQIAKKVDGVLINADSVQVYKYMNIGSNKGNIKTRDTIKLSEWKIIQYEVEQSGINGMLFDIVEPDYNFTVAHYQQLANLAIKYVRAIGKVPIIVGGTGLYIDSVIKGYVFEKEEINSDLRNELESLEIHELKKKLIELSPEVYEDLNESDRHNPRRLIRLIEKLLNNRPIKNQTKNILDHLFIYPEFKKPELMEKIETRVEWMFANGLIEEVQDLINKGYTLEHKAMQSTGYKEISLMLVENKYGIEDCKQAVKLAHKKYAKRQITWFEGTARGYKLLPFSSFSFLFVTFFVLCSLVIF
jgi:tRNA dimethylallyltransferase